MPSNPHHFSITKVDVESASEAFDYALDVCRDKSLSALSRSYGTEATPSAVVESIASDFPEITRAAVRKGCIAGFAARAPRG